MYETIIFLQKSNILHKNMWNHAFISHSQTMMCCRVLRLDCFKTTALKSSIGPKRGFNSNAVVQSASDGCNCCHALNILSSYVWTPGFCPSICSQYTFQWPLMRFFHHLWFVELTLFSCTESLTLCLLTFVQF